MNKYIFFFLPFCLVEKGEKNMIIGVFYFSWIYAYTSKGKKKSLLHFYLWEMCMYVVEEVSVLLFTWLFTNVQPVKEKKKCMFTFFAFSYIAIRVEELCSMGSLGLRSIRWEFRYGYIIIGL